MMRALLTTTLVLFTVACGKIPLQQPASAVEAPAVTWQGVYAANCAACHGATGELGGARPMKNATYLATIPRVRLVEVTSKGQGTLMPALAASQGGPIADADVQTLVDGMIGEWGKGGTPASVAWEGPLGNADNGATLYAANCQTCHGAANGKAPGTHGSITDPNYLRLVSDQSLRSSIVFGRADLHASCDGPYPGQAANKRMTSSEVADVVAFLASKRPQMGSTKR